jgi:hypothetical protein
MGGGKMKKLIFLFLSISTFFLLPSVFADESFPSGSPYDFVIETGKNTTSFVDAMLDSGTEINRQTTGKIADFLTNSAIWKKLSARAQEFLSKNASEIGPLVKKAGWLINIIDLAPSLYNTGLSFLQRDKVKFIESFRDSTLKVVSIAGGLAVGAVVTAALPLVVTTSGIGAVALACGGAILSVSMSMLADKVIKDNFSQKIESFASSVYESLVYNSIFSSILKNGEDSSGGVKLDALQW